MALEMSPEEAAKVVGQEVPAAANENVPLKRGTSAEEIKEYLKGVLGGDKVIQQAVEVAQTPQEAARAAVEAAIRNRSPGEAQESVISNRIDAGAADAIEGRKDSPEIEEALKSIDEQIVEVPSAAVIQQQQMQEQQQKQQQWGGNVAASNGAAGVQQQEQPVQQPQGKSRRREISLDEEEYRDVKMIGQQSRGESAKSGSAKKELDSALAAEVPAVAVAPALPPPALPKPTPEAAPAEPIVPEQPKVLPAPSEVEVPAQAEAIETESQSPEPEVPETEKQEEGEAGASQFNAAGKSLSEMQAEMDRAIAESAGISIPGDKSEVKSEMTPEAAPASNITPEAVEALAKEGKTPELPHESTALPEALEAVPEAPPAQAAQEVDAAPVPEPAPEAVPKPKGMPKQEEAKPPRGSKVRAAVERVVGSGKEVIAKTGKGFERLDAGARKFVRRLYLTGPVGAVLGAKWRMEFAFNDALARFHGERASKHGRERKEDLELLADRQEEQRELHAQLGRATDATGGEGMSETVSKQAQKDREALDRAAVHLGYSAEEAGKREAYWFKRYAKYETKRDAAQGKLGKRTAELLGGTGERIEKAKTAVVVFDIKHSQAKAKHEGVLLNIERLEQQWEEEKSKGKVIPESVRMHWEENLGNAKSEVAKARAILSGHEATRAALAENLSELNERKKFLRFDKWQGHKRADAEYAASPSEVPEKAPTRGWEWQSVFDESDAKPLAADFFARKWNQYFKHVQRIDPENFKKLIAMPGSSETEFPVNDLANKLAVYITRRDPALKPEAVRKDLETLGDYLHDQFA